MKSFRHRVECHDGQGRFLGAAEFKTLRRWPSERALRDELLQRLRAVVQPDKGHRHVFVFNQPWGADSGPQGRKRGCAPAAAPQGNSGEDKAADAAAKGHQS